MPGWWGSGVTVADVPAAPAPPPPGGRDTPPAGQPGGQSGAGSRAPGSRLRPPPPEQWHTPLLLGLDEAGAEHPQGPGDPDDETLIARRWGCSCGWRGTRREVTARHFHPRVGDGGRLRRQRLARSDREHRGELDAHLAAITPATPVPTAAGPGTPPPGPGAPTTATADGAGDPPIGPPPRRRRLTLPREPDPAGAPRAGGWPRSPEPPEPPAPRGLTERASAAAVTSPLPAPPAAGSGPGDPAHPTEPAGAESDARGGATDGADAMMAAGSSAPEHTPAGQTRLEETPTEQTPGAVGAGSRGDEGGDELAAAARRVRRARDELDAAERALDAAVQAARAGGASWRAIARATGIAHRTAAARWGPATGGPTLSSERGHPG